MGTKLRGTCGESACLKTLKGCKIQLGKTRIVDNFVARNRKALSSLKFPISEAQLKAILRVLNKSKTMKLKDFFYKYTPIDYLGPRLDRFNIKHLVLTGEHRRCKGCNVTIISGDGYGLCCLGIRSKEDLVKSKLKKTTVERHGGQAMGSSKTRRKIESTNIKRYGNKVATANPEIHKRLEKTTLERHGGIFRGSPAIDAKVLASNELKTKVDPEWRSDASLKAHSTRKTLDKQNPERVVNRARSISEKWKLHHADVEYMRKHREKWGDAMHRKLGDNWRKVFKDRLNKARYKAKTVTIKGKTFVCQGYEPYVLKHLVGTGVSVENIAIEDESFPYLKRNGSIGYYFPDIFVRGFSEIIEVKSIYTCGLLSKSFRIWNALKRKSLGVSESGRPLRVVVVDPKLGYFTIKNPHTLLRADVLKLINYKPFAFK